LVAAGLLGVLAAGLLGAGGLLGTPAVAVTPAPTAPPPAAAVTARIAVLAGGFPGFGRLRGVAAALLPVGLRPGGPLIGVILAGCGAAVAVGARGILTGGRGPVGPAV